MEGQQEEDRGIDGHAAFRPGASSERLDAEAPALEREQDPFSAADPQLAPHGHASRAVLVDDRGEQRQEPLERQRRLVARDRPGEPGGSRDVVPVDEQSVSSVASTADSGVFAPANGSTIGSPTTVRANAISSASAASDRSASTLGRRSGSAAR